MPECDVLKGRKAFDFLAPYYDALMVDVDYDLWSDRLFGLFSEYGHVPHRVLELACGTGNMTHNLANLSDYLLALDYSPSMLAKIAVKCGNSRIKPCLIAADLTALPVRCRGSRGFDTVLSFYDSLNFVTDSDKLQALFSEVSNLLTDDGLFLFDMVTEHCVRKSFAGQTWEEVHEGFAAAWSCTFDSQSGVIITRIEIDGRGTAELRERVYTVAEVSLLLERASLEIRDIHETFTGKRVNPESNRIDFVTMKKR